MLSQRNYTSLNSSKSIYKNQDEAIIPIHPELSHEMSLQMVGLLSKKTQTQPQDHTRWI